MVRLPQTPQQCPKMLGHLREQQLPHNHRIFFWRKVFFFFFFSFLFPEEGGECRAEKQRGWATQQADECWLELGMNQYLHAREQAALFL